MMNLGSLEVCKDDEVEEKPAVLQCTCTFVFEGFSRQFSSVIKHQRKRMK